MGDLTQWDLTMQQVIPFIDGVNYVGRIAKLTGVSLRCRREGEDSVSISFFVCLVYFNFPRYHWILFSNACAT